MKTTTRRALVGAFTTLALLPTGAHAAAGLSPADTLPGTVAASTTEEAEEDAQLLLLLDGSRSMEDPDAEGNPKIDAAKSAVRAVIADLDPQQQVGLRTFGATVPVDQPTEAKCTDSELVVPIGSGNATALNAAVDDYTPTGETPIAHALQEAAADLGESGNRTVLLVSDGIATCDPDPCEVAEQLTADGLDLQVHTVGLGADEATRSQLQCIAEAAGGTYYDAQDTESLTEALTRLTTRAFRPFTIMGTPVVGSLEIPDAPVLAPGLYTDTIAIRESTRKHYAIERTAPGSRIYVGATMRPSRPGGSSAFTLRLQTRDGRNCSTTVAAVFSMGMTNSFGSAGTSTADSGSGECAEADTIIASIEAQGGSEQILDQPLEITVEELGPATNEDALPGGAADAEWSGLESGRAAGEVRGGASFHDAPLVEPGTTYDTDLVPGEIAFFRVPVDYGQGLEALVEVPNLSGPLADEVGAITDIVDVAIYSPQRAEVHDVLADTPYQERVVVNKNQVSRAAATMPEVRWLNKDADGEGTVAGDYIVMVSLTSDREKLVPLPMTLTTNLVGEPHGAPTLAAPGTGDVAAQTGDLAEEATGDETGATEDVQDSVTGSSPPVEDEGGTGATAESGAEEGADEAGVPALVWALGGAGVLLAAVGAILLGRRSAA